MSDEALEQPDSPRRPWRLPFGWLTLFALAWVAYELTHSPASVLQVGRSVSRSEALSDFRQPPVELLPYLMLLLLAVLTMEGLLANRFYRRVPEPGAVP